MKIELKAEVDGKQVGFSVEFDKFPKYMEFVAIAAKLYKLLKEAAAS